MLLKKKQPLDGKPTMAEWPVKIWSAEEFPLPFQNEVSGWMTDDFTAYHFVYAPKQKTVESSHAYLFGYDKEKLLYLTQDGEKISRTEFLKTQIRRITVKKELLHMSLNIQYEKNGSAKELSLPYVASVYYLYDPFLNWMLGLDREFQPAIAEKENPRPQKLLQESFAMYNFSLNAYRLGHGFSDYRYRRETKPLKWMPWKREVREWLEIPMERGLFTVFSDGYYKETCYLTD